MRAEEIVFILSYIAHIYFNTFWDVPELKKPVLFTLVKIEPPFLIYNSFGSESI